MLADFIIANRDAILSSTRARRNSRGVRPAGSDDELTNGIPLFLGQLVDALRLAKVSDEIDHEQMSQSARYHGRDLLQLGHSIGQVVFDYGDVCQVITKMASQQSSPIRHEEFRTLSLCLDDAIAEAVASFARQREQAIEDSGTERLGILAHELRNGLNTALLAFEIISSGQVAIGGSTGLMLGRSLLGLRDLIDRSLTEVRLDAGLKHQQSIAVGEFIEELQVGAAMQATSRGLRFEASTVESTVTIEGDRQILLAAVSNLLQNAFKFTHENTLVSLTTIVTADRVQFEVEDACGGLPSGTLEGLFRPFEQRSPDRSGLGLGLSICLKAARANGGELTARDIPGQGCVFVLDLPRKPPPLALVGELGAGAPCAALEERAMGTS